MIDDTAETDNEPMVKIPLRIVRDPSITGRTFKVLAVVASRFEISKGRFEINESEVAKESGYSEQAVRVAIQELERRGYLERPLPPNSVRFVDDDGTESIFTVTAEGFRTLGMEPR